MIEYGFPVDSFQLRCIVEAYLDRCGRTITVFKSNTPGKKWAVALLKRQQALTTRLASNIQRKRAKVSKSIITEYISNLSKEVEEVPPENIWNYGETNLTDDPGPKCVLTKKGQQIP